MRDPTKVVWRRCLAAGTAVLLTAAVLLAPVLITGDVHTSKHGCPDPVPAGHDCFRYRSTSYLMRDSVFVWFVVTVIILIVVLFVVPHLVFGCSLGKAAFGIRVVRGDGTSPGVLRSVVRAVAWVVDGLALGLPLGLWLAIFTPGHRRVGDLLAGTYVVRRSAAHQPVRLPPRRGPLTGPPVV